MLRKCLKIVCNNKKTEPYCTGNNQGLFKPRTYAMARKAYQTDLIDKEWLLIEALLPARQSTKGRKSMHDRREILNALFSITQSQRSALQISSALKEYEVNIQDYTGTKQSVALVFSGGAEEGKANFGEIILNVELMMRKLTERSSSFSSISQPISKRHIRGISQPYLLIIFE
jgi:hypothetical protein